MTRQLASDFTLITNEHPEAEKHPAWTSFMKALDGHEIGGEALSDAWWFFRTGWQAFEGGSAVTWRGR